MDKAKLFFKSAGFPIVWCILSVVLTIISETSVVNQFLIQLFGPNIEGTKEWVKVIIYAGFVLPISAQSIKRGITVLSTDELLKNYGLSQHEFVKVSMNNEYVNRNNADAINIRIFRKSRKYLVSRDMDGFVSEKIGRTLRFSIDSDEGLVTKCYKEKLLQIETEDGCKSVYRLSKYHQAAVRGYKFIVAVPVCDYKGKIRCIVCFDSKNKVTIRAGQKEELLTFLSTAAYNIAEVIDGQYS